MGEILSVP
jgi:hypothetical protein